MEEISLYGKNGKPDWFLELNPDGTVPVLECYGGAIILPDSDLILDNIGTCGRPNGGSGEAVVRKGGQNATRGKEGCAGW